MYFYVEVQGAKPIVVESAHKQDVVNAYPKADVNYIPYPLSVCIAPESCKGHTSCPRKYSCSE